MCLHAWPFEVASIVRRTQADMSLFGLVTLSPSFPPHPGSYFLRCSEVEIKLEQSHQRFQEKARAEFMTPLKAFLEIDVKSVMVSKDLL